MPFALLLGGLLGLAALARGEALLLLPFLAHPAGAPPPAACRVAAAVCAMFAVVLTPWTIRNWSAFDRPVLVATEGGETLAGANCDGTYHGTQIGTWQYCVAQFKRQGQLSQGADRGRPSQGCATRATTPTG